MILALGSFALSQAKPALGQSTESSPLETRISLLVQPRLTYGSDRRDSLERVGFGLRRARFRTVLTYEKRMGVHLDFDLASGAASAVDLFAFYQLTPTLRFRFGYLPGAQPRAHIMTPFPSSDGPDRAAISERWARATIGPNGRDLGVEAQYTAGGTRASLYLHNGDGALSRSNFRAVIGGSSATSGVDQRGIAFSGYVSQELKSVRGLEIGGFAGYNTSKNPNTAAETDGPGRNYGSYSAHAYWGAIPGSQPIRLKAEVIGISYAENEEAPSQQAIGYGITGAVRLFKGAEVVGAFEQFALDTDGDADSYVLVGLNFSPSARRGEAFYREKFTLAYLQGTPAGETSDSQHLLVMQFQVAIW